MNWIALSEKDTAAETLEKRLWDAVDQIRAKSGLKAQEFLLGEFAMSEGQGVEKTDETGRLCRLNLAIHGLEGGNQTRRQHQQLLRRPARRHQRIRAITLDLMQPWQKIHAPLMEVAVAGPPTTDVDGLHGEAKAEVGDQGRQWESGGKRR